MKSLVLLTFFSLNPGEPLKNGPTEFFDNEQMCQVRMQELRQQHSTPGTARCSCHKTVPPVSAEGNDAI
jgi:hypothetical protein